MFTSDYINIFILLYVIAYVIQLNSNAEENIAKTREKSFFTKLIEFFINFCMKLDLCTIYIIFYTKFTDIENDVC